MPGPPVSAAQRRHPPSLRHRAGGPAIGGIHRNNPRYAEPSEYIALINALKPGQWLTFQAYILVTGKNPPYTKNKTRWDCTSPNPALHWTNDVERYCYNDWQQVVQAIAARQGLIVTDPLTVGVAFGRPAAYP